MPIEIEKKFRLTATQREAIVRRLGEIGAQHEGEAFEENLLFDGPALKQRNCVLRLRRVAGKAIITFKERLPATSATKHQREEETLVQDGDALQRILDDLGYTPKILYEKKRDTWRMGGVEIVLDELPFGSFMEIEGSEIDIEDAEKLLAIAGLTAERATYPQLAAIAGTLVGNVIEARFNEESGPEL
jgi:adenylate cyclase class 2